MALPTRNDLFRTPLRSLLARRQATTRRKCKFFEVLARSGATRSLRSISKECGITEGTGRNWKEHKAELGSLA
jgi:hypothetical protein